jgi:hypothetical protein
LPEGGTDPKFRSDQSWHNPGSTSMILRPNIWCTGMLRLRKSINLFNINAGRFGIPTPILKKLAELADSTIVQLLFNYYLDLLNGTGFG